MKSSTMIGGKSNQHGRNAADFYATPPECTIALLDEFGWLFEGLSVWEPACGDGAITKVLRSKKYEVYSSDKYSRGYGLSKVDFLKSEMWPQSIITNPPFNLAEQFIEKAVTREVPFAMLLKATYWHAAKRNELFNRTRPLAVMAMSWRPAMSPERGKSGTMDFIWTVWGSKPSLETKYIVSKKPTLPPQQGVI
jgi:hypothetical protein|tara:strand:+ start:123 stop:704 length:582 start_codon:yes stop_codon:yes gene_type:complete